MGMAVGIIIGVVVAIVVILVLIGVAFNAGFKRDQKKMGEECLWHDRKRTKLGLPWSFTKYSLSEDRIFIQTGFAKTTYDEARLYRVLDVKMTQTLGQKIIGIGTVTLHTSDKALGCFSMINIKNPMEVKEMISKNVEIQRDKHRVYSRESMVDYDDDAAVSEEADN